MVRRGNSGVKNRTSSIKKSAAVRFQTQRSTQSVALHTIELGSGREKKVGGCAWLDGRFAMVAKYGAGRSIYIYKSKLKRGRERKRKLIILLVASVLTPWHVVVYITLPIGRVIF